MDLEIVLGIAMVIVGIVSLIMVIQAKGKLQEAGELKTIINMCILVILFLTAYSIWHVLREAFHWKRAFGSIAEYPEYIFISIAYIMVFRTAKTLNNIVKIFERL